MSGKFKAQADAMTNDLSRLFNRAIRLSLRAGIAAAVNKTTQDSSNAAFHWLVAESSKSRPGNRSTGDLRDLRQTKGVRGPARSKTGTVGFRGDKRSNSYATLNYVRTRETEQVINKYVVGRNPSGKFYFFNALHEQKSAELSAGDLEEYASNVNLEDAGTAAVEATQEAFQRYMANGMARKT